MTLARWMARASRLVSGRPRVRHVVLRGSVLHIPEIIKNLNKIVSAGWMAEIIDRCQFRSPTGAISSPEGPCDLIHCCKYNDPLEG